MPVVPPPLVALAAGVAQRALTGGTQPPSRGHRTVAVGVSLASASMAGAAAGRFRRSGTTVEPFHPEEASVLVTAGANAISRNPMYVGMAGLLVAHAIWRGSWVALAPVAAFVAFIDRVQIRAEESALLEKFGPAYDAYRAATPRWLDLRSANAAHPGR
jgi:protein-S-isoprenylcysteine O-methyltransferase Ste14